MDDVLGVQVFLLKRDRRHPLSPEIILVTWIQLQLLNSMLHFRQDLVEAVPCVARVIHFKDAVKTQVL